ncbi:MAG: Phosphomannomutase [Candidatus Saccharibacteria bacterium]|jgi:phosphomannomutase|nr:Phosphomannomutase [Candidatus Saccharibacteria bacterium]
MNFTESIFKAYDIRGISGEELTNELAHAVGRAVADFLPDSGPVIVGRDMRVDSNDLAKAVIEGLTKQGRDVWDIGLVTTDMVYFGAGRFADEVAGGVMVTASHNPGKYNGIKLIGRGSVPMGAQNGLMDIKEIVKSDGYKPAAETAGKVTERSITKEWVDKIVEFLDVEALPKWRIAVDAGNGMGGAIFPALQERLPFEVEQMYFELDGTFPNHVANPHLVETLADLCATIKKNKLDFGLAFDGDGDRGGLVDDEGNPLPEHIIGAMLSKQFLADNPGAKIVVDLRVSHVVKDTIEANGGTYLRSKVGNDAIKTIMRNEDAVLGIEASGHYYFRDAYFSDSGIIAVMSVVNILAKSGKKLSELVSEFGQAYATAHETNFEVEDKQGAFDRVREKYQDGEQDELDGLTVSYGDWWFNIRASNTEPVVRLNVEAKDQATLEHRLAELTQLIGG